MFTLGSPIFRCSYCGSSRIKTCANACDHGLSFKSLSRATPCISSLKKRILSPVVENKNIGLAVSLFCLHIGEEYFHWLIKNNQPMRTFLANSSWCCYVNKPNQRYGNPCKKKWLGNSYQLHSRVTRWATWWGQMIVSQEGTRRWGGWPAGTDEVGTGADGVGTDQKTKLCHNSYKDGL